MAVITLDKIIFRNNDSYLKMYKGSELIAEVESTPALDYLTFTALEAGSTVNFNRTGVTSEYSTDEGNTWNSGDNVTVTLNNVGDKVMYRGVTNTTSGSVTTTAFTLTGQVKASGNVNSMVNNNPDDTSLNSKEYAFMNYFRKQAALKDISELVLPATTLTRSCYSYMFSSTGITTIPDNLLPSTTLTSYCYQGMFYQCSRITTIPANLLPATTLSDNCYNNMFSGVGIATIPVNLLPATTLANYCYFGMFSTCWSLTTIPANLLPATTLATDCYGSMFNGCHYLTTTLTLPATTLATDCYTEMFRDCATLTTIPANLLPATTLARNCYQGMFRGCTGITTIPDNFLPVTTLADSCYNSMFYGCNKLTTAPTLPATTLRDHCYANMFQNCTKLNKVVTYAQDISATNCLYGWLTSVSSTGTFYNYGGATYTSGNSGIPEGWAVRLFNYLTFTALEAGSTVNFNRTGVTSEYSTDDGTTWNSGDNVTVTLSNVGDKVMYRGVTSTISSSAFAAFTLTGQVKASGNVNSMINNNPDDTSLERSGIFREYFYNQDALIDISELKLPATTLTSNCYYKMFFSCNGLTTISANLLPATTLASSCYDSMFENCTSLTTAPKLPAITLADSCYSNMFNGCTSLTTTPTLPATTLTSYCYSYMFSGCTNLNMVVTYSQDISATNCLNNWLSNVSSTGNFYNHGKATYPSGDSGIPEGWTVHLLDYLTLTALQANSTVKFSRSGVTSEYSTDNGSTWNSGDNVTVTLNNVGDKVMYRGVTSSPSAASTPTFTLTGLIKASGSINSMINRNPDDTSLNSKTYVFHRYFSGQTALKDISELVLPATTLTSYCYSYMFYGCNKLTTAPTLPATTLTSYCYQYMFQGCTELTTAPTLPATTLTSYCYQYMFQSCTKLKKVVTYARSISATNCLRRWLSNASSTGDFYNLGGATYPSGNSGIPSGWTKHTHLLDYLTFTALEAGSTITFNRTGVTSEYSTDNGSTWTSGDNVTVTLSNVGNKVMYRGVTSTDIDYTDTTSFTLAGQVKASGSVMSMINKNPDDTSLNSKNYAFQNYFYYQAALKDISELKLPATTLTNYCYSSMFSRCFGITTIPDNFLPAMTLARGCYYSMFFDSIGLTTVPENLLSATTLADNCYAYMFQGCTELTTAPTLPATTLTNNCYQSMFQSCTKLTTIPTLPATTLANYCYSSMFHGCTSLTALPENLLPVTTLARNCYSSMFYGCIGLTTIPANLLPATTLEQNCYSEMFGSCTGLTTAPNLPATTLTNNCYQSMFRGCTSLTTAPNLPATTLTNYCYQSMFQNCSNLNRVVTYAQDISASSCLTNWLSSVSSTGDFYNLGGASYSSGVSGIPTGWTVHTTL